MKKSKKRKLTDENVSALQTTKLKKAKYDDDIFKDLEPLVSIEKPQSLWDREDDVTLLTPEPPKIFANELARLQMESIEQKLLENLAFVQILKQEVQTRPNVVVPYTEIAQQLDKISDLSGLWRALSGQLIYPQAPASVQTSSPLLWSIFQPPVVPSVNTFQPAAPVNQMRR